jgi:long-chain fatty acid transport protein
VRCFALVIAAALLLASRDANAAGTDLPDQAASASGTGGASTARSGDPAAAYFNPAALVDGKGLRAGVGSTFALASLSAESSPGAPPPSFAIGTERSLRAIPYLAASYAYEWLMAGVSVHVPFGGGVAWPASSPLRFEAVESSVRVIRIAPFLGLGGRRASIAVGPHFDLGSLEVKRATNHVLEEGSVHLASSGSSVGGQIAALVRPVDELAIGVSYKSKSAIPLTGDADFEVPPTFAPQYPDQAVHSRLKLPERIAVGVAWSIVRSTRLFVDATYTGWATNDALVFDFESAQTPDSRIDNDWRDTLALRAGVEHDLNESFTLRGGLFVDGVAGPAAPAHNLSPASPDMTRVGGSFGAGVTLIEGVALDAFYQPFVLLSRTSTSADYPLATYSGSAHLFGLGARLHWDPAP